MTLVHSFKKQTFAGTVQEKDERKSMVFKSPKFLQFFLNQHTKSGDPLSITVEVKKPKRTVLQNNYYWGIYLPLIAEETGHSVMDLHELFKGKFLGGEVVEVLGEKVRRKGSTTDLSVNDFSEYIQAIEELTGVPAPETDVVK